MGYNDPRGTCLAFSIINADITTLNVDAIVNPTDQYYSGGGGIDRVIHRICGPALYEATSRLPKLHLGEARATEEFGLPCRFIIHTSGPRWFGQSTLESMVLGSCYRNSMVLAQSLGCKSIAFPLIASQGKGFPKEVAFTVAINAIEECVQEFPGIAVTLAVYGRWTEHLSSDLFATVGSYISSTYVPNDDYINSFVEPPYVKEEALKRVSETTEDSDFSPSICFKTAGGPLDEDELKNLIEKPTPSTVGTIQLDESFAQMLNRLLKERNLPNSAIQDELGMSGAGFWKLLNGKSNPSRLTVFGIAIAFLLSLDETKDMLSKAGYAINPSSLQDLVLAALIQYETYDRNIIDDLLDSLDLQPLPGA